MNTKPDHLLFPDVVTAKISCGCCGKVINLTDAVVSTRIITPHITQVDHFCSTRCAEIKWRMR